MGPGVKTPGLSRREAGPKRGLPLVPTLMVLAAMPILIGFGAWQLQRAQWKDALLLELAQNQDAPLLELGGGPIPDDAQFRLVRLELQCAGGLTALRAGRSLAGQSGYSYLVECRAGTTAVTRDAGWNARPKPLAIPAVTATFEGRLVRGPRARWILVDADPDPPLEPSAPPGIGTISDNHLSYAMQWFGFAVILAVIYAIHVRRWRRGEGGKLASDGTRS